MERTYSTRSCAHEARVEAKVRWAERPSLWEDHEKTDTRRERIFPFRLQVRRRCCFCFPFSREAFCHTFGRAYPKVRCVNTDFPFGELVLFFFSKKQQKGGTRLRSFRAAHTIRLHCVRPNRRTFSFSGRAQKNRQSRKTRGKPVFCG